MAEFEFNSAVAGYAKQCLEQAGYEVILTQPLDGNSVKLQKRLQIAKENKVDFLISIHADYNQDPKPRGHWIFYWQDNEIGKKYAKYWGKIAQGNLSNPSRGMRAGSPTEWCNFFMTRETHKADISAVLIEHGFMSNPEDLELLKSDSFRKLSALTILEAVKEMYPIPEDWRVEMGKKALAELHARGLLKYPEQIVNLHEPLPAWLQLVLYRITKKESP